MAARTLPGLGLTAYWDVGTAYKTEMDTNLRTLSAVTQLSVISATTTLPASPANGSIYINPAAGANLNKVAIRDAGAWVYLTPLVGWTAFIKDTGKLAAYTGTAWEVIGGDSGTPTGGAGALLKFTAFKANATWTRTAGATKIMVECVGAGGGGGGATFKTGNIAVGAGGGGGGFHRVMLDVTGLASAAVVVGVAGTAGANTGGTGGNGGMSSFNAPAVQSDGGIGGPGMLADVTISFAQGGNGGTAGNTAAEVNANGTIGGDGMRLSATVGISGRGAPGIWGGGGQGRSWQSAGQAGLAPGAGGSGGCAVSAAVAGGVGGPGRVLIWEYS